MSWRRRWSLRLSLAVSALFVAVSNLCWSILSLGNFATVSPELLPAAQTTTPIPQVRPATPVEVERLAVEEDPFHPERRRPAIGFRLPGEGIPDSQVVVRPEASPLVLIGTAVLPGTRSFAMCQVGAEPPKMVRIGEQVGGFTLKEVSQGRAVFLTAQGSTVEVGVPKAGS